MGFQKLCISFINTLSIEMFFVHFQQIVKSMAKKNQNKNKAAQQVNAQKRRDKRKNRREGNDDCDPEMKIQLEKIGLGLKEVEGDG